jgi:hypothetical protein
VLLGAPRNANDTIFLVRCKIRDLTSPAPGPFVFAKSTLRMLRPGNTVPSLRDITLEELNNGLGEKDFSSFHIVQAYLARIKEVDDKSWSILELNDDAESIAR